MTLDTNNVLQQCQSLLDDIKTYKGFDQPPSAEEAKGDDIWTFYRSAVEAKEPSRVRSTNLKHFLEVWKVAKSVPHVYAIHKFFPHGPYSTHALWSARSQRNRFVDAAPTTQIDVVAGDSCRTRYFIKVSTVDEKRLGHDLVRIQWDEFDSEDDERNYDARKKGESEYISQTPIAAVARQLVSAAEMAGATPLLVLPYLSRDEDHRLFKYFDSIGLQYHCQSDDYPVFDHAPGVRTAQSPNLPPRRVALDITTLLSIVADVCNLPPLSIEYENEKCAQVDQVQWEARAPTLPEAIYPFLETADELIAPPGIVEKMRQLLDTIGSNAEKQRAAILFGSEARDSLIDQYNRLTIHPIPASTPLPVEVVPVPEDFVSPLSREDLEKLSVEAVEVYNLAISLPEGAEVATANKQLAKIIRLHYFVERNAMGVGGRVLLHQPRSLRGFGKIVHLPLKQLDRLSG